MPSGSKLPGNRHAGRRTVSRKRYDDAEKQRIALLVRLGRLSERNSASPGYKTAKILLQQRFRVAHIDQRVEICRAANWLIELIEMDYQCRRNDLSAQADPPRSSDPTTV